MFKLIACTLLALSPAVAFAEADFEIPIDVDYSGLGEDRVYEIEELGGKMIHPGPPPFRHNHSAKPAKPPTPPSERVYEMEDFGGVMIEEGRATTPPAPAPDPHDFHIEVEDITMPVSKLYPYDIGVPYSMLDDTTMPASKEYPYNQGPKIARESSMMSGLPSLLSKEPVRIYIEQSPTQNIPGLVGDVEVALQIWFKAAGKQDALIGIVKDPAYADLIIRVSDTSLNPRGFGNGAASSYVAGSHLGTEASIPVIELRTGFDATQWISINEARAKAGVSIVNYHGRKVLRALHGIVGKSGNPATVADYLLKHKPAIDGAGDLVVSDLGIKRLAYVHLFRQLGHLLGYQKHIEKQQHLFPSKVNPCEELLTATQ